MLLLVCGVFGEGRREKGCVGCASIRAVCGFPIIASVLGADANSCMFPTRFGKSVPVSLHLAAETKKAGCCRLDGTGL